MINIPQTLLRTQGALAIIGTIGWFLSGGPVRGALFGFMACLGALYLLATEWTIRFGIGGNLPRRWLSLLLHFGKLGLLLLLLRGMIIRFPSQEGPLLSGALLHVLSLFVVAIRRGFQRTPQ